MHHVASQGALTQDVYSVKNIVRLNSLEKHFQTLKNKYYSHTKYFKTYNTNELVTCVVRALDSNNQGNTIILHLW
jgi:hypothetical protein